jgi:tetratricopeptide (TPR) repeat protein
MAAAHTSIDALIGVALQHVNAGLRDRARVLCEHALTHFAPHPAVHQLLALLDLQQGNATDAREHATASLVLRADHVPTLLLAADAARALGAPTDAQRHLERVIALAPTHADAWFQLALVRQDARDFQGAESALREVLRLAPPRAEVEVNLGIVLQEAGKLDEAMRAYGRAYRAGEETFGRIAHALAAAPVGCLWLNLAELRAALRATPA